MEEITYLVEMICHDGKRESSVVYDLEFAMECKKKFEATGRYISVEVFKIISKKIV